MSSSIHYIEVQWPPLTGGRFKITCKCNQFKAEANSREEALLKASHHQRGV
jgi:hypothetical protein